jgi:hypothetical protein
MAGHQPQQYGVSPTQQYGPQSAGGHGSHLPSAYAIQQQQKQQAQQEQQMQQQQYAQQQQQQMSGHGQPSRYPTQYNQSSYGQQMYGGSREGQSSSQGASAGIGGKKKSIFNLDFVKTKWPRIFFLISLVQAILAITFEA